MIVAYHGNGKGKTSAAIGHIIRAFGHFQNIAFCQFVKKDGTSGEQQILRTLLGEDNVKIGGLGFLPQDKRSISLHKKAATETFRWAKGKIKTVNLLVMDEVLDTIEGKWLVREDMRELLVKYAGNFKRHLVMTGHQIPGWIYPLADYTTEFIKDKHPFDWGQAPLAGIEF